MNKTSNILWGVVFLILGLIFGLNAFQITNISLFFSGWWTFFLIIPCFISLFNSNESKTGNLIGLVIGIFLFLACNHIISFELIWKLSLPFIFVTIGLSFFLKNMFYKKEKNKVVVAEEYYAIFERKNVDFSDKFNIQGIELNAVCGLLECNLKDTNIKEDIHINCSSIFGDIEMIVPENVNIVVRSTNIFGGVSRKNKNSKENKYTIFINATCMFGGVNIK